MHFRLETAPKHIRDTGYHHSNAKIHRTPKSVVPSCVWLTSKFIVLWKHLSPLNVYKVGRQTTQYRITASTGFASSPRRFSGCMPRADTVL